MPRGAHTATSAFQLRTDAASEHPVRPNEGRSASSGDTAARQVHHRPIPMLAQQKPEYDSGDTRSPIHRRRRRAPALKRRPEHKPRRHMTVLAQPRHTNVAQRRPEHKPRRHTIVRGAARGLCRPLNEGRSTNPGDTWPTSKRPASASHCAQRRPEYKPRRHAKAMRGHRTRRPTAQRRPEHKPRRHTIVGTRYNFDDIAQRRPEHKPRRHPRPDRIPSPAPRPLNEGRSINPGDTTARSSPVELGQQRSTKAGA